MSLIEFADLLNGLIALSEDVFGLVIDVVVNNVGVVRHALRFVLNVIRSLVDQHLALFHLNEHVAVDVVGRGARSSIVFIVGNCEEKLLSSFLLLLCVADFDGGA